MGVADELGAVAGFVVLAAGLGVDVGVGVCEEVACPGALATGAAAVTFGARAVVAVALAFAAGAFFAGAAAFVSSTALVVLAGLDARVFGAGLTALATVETFSAELVAAVFVEACLGFAAAATVAFGFFSTASLIVSLTTLTCSLVAWAFFGRVVETLRIFRWRIFVLLSGETPVVNQPLLHLDRSCVLGPNLNILSILYVELRSKQDFSSQCATGQPGGSLAK